MIQVCKNNNNQCVLATRRNETRTTFITIKKHQRSVVVLSNKLFDKQYRPINHSPVAAIEAWLSSTIPMTVSVRKEIQMVIAILRNKIVAQVNTVDELEVSEKATIINGMESLEGMTMKQLVKLYNVTLGKDDKVKVIPGAEGDINEAASITLDALEMYELPEKPVKAKTERVSVARVPRDGVITLLAVENPKRVGSKSYERFDNYATGMTVAAALEAGLTSGDINYDLGKGYISVA